MKCQVTLWGSNVSLNVEVACTAHGTLGFTDEDTARGIRDAHLDTGGAPVETGPGASPEPNRCHVYPYTDDVLVHNTFLAYAVECLVPECGWSEDDWAYPGIAGDAGRQHLAEVHG